MELLNLNMAALFMASDARLAVGALAALVVVLFFGDRLRAAAAAVSSVLASILRRTVNESIRLTLRHAPPVGAALFVLSLLAWVGLGLWGLAAAGYFDNSASMPRDSGLWMVLRGLSGLLKLLVSDLPIGSDRSASIALTNWQLDIAGTAGPLAATILAFGGLGRWIASLFHESLARLVVRRHIVIIGAGGAGQNLLRDILQHPTCPPGPTVKTMGRASLLSRFLSTAKHPARHLADWIDSPHRRSVVVLEPRSETLESLRSARLGAILIEGDATEPTTFVKVGIARAAVVFISTGDDARNTEIAGKIRQWCSSDRVRPWFPWLRDRRSLLVIPVVNDQAIRNQLLETSGFLKRPQSRTRAVRIVPFSSDEVAARRLVERHPAALYARLLGASRAHLLIVGFGEITEEVLSQTLQSSIHANLDPTIVTLIAPESAHEVRARLRRNYPGLEAILQQLQIEIRILEAADRRVDADLLAQVDEGLEPTRPNDSPIRRAPRHPVTSIYVCGASDAESMRIAFQIQSYTRAHRRLLAPTFVRLESRTSLEEVMGPTTRTLELANVVQPFGLGEETCTIEEVFRPRRIEAAQRLNDDYSAAYGAFALDWRPQPRHARGIPDRFGSFVGAWEQLPLHIWRANLAQIAHIPVKWDAIGWRHTDCAIVEEQENDLPDESTLNLLGKNEHERWCVERSFEGWAYHPTRDNEARRHELLKPYKDLDDDKKRPNSWHVSVIYRYPGRYWSGPAWSRDLRIGLIAHGRPNAQALSDLKKRIADRIRQEWPEDAVGAPRLPAVTFVVAQISKNEALLLDAALQLWRRPSWPRRLWDALARRLRLTDGEPPIHRLPRPRVLVVRPYDKWHKQRKDAIARAAPAASRSWPAALRTTLLRACDRFRGAQNQAPNPGRPNADLEDFEAWWRIESRFEPDWWVLDALPAGTSLAEVVERVGQDIQVEEHLNECALQEVQNRADVVLRSCAGDH